MTDAGRRLLERAQEALASFDGIKRHLAGQAARPAGRVRLCIAGSLAAVVIAPLLRAVARHYPEIELSVSDGLSSEVRMQVESGRAHLALMPSAAELFGMDSLPVFEEQFLLIGACQAMASEPAQVALSALKGRPLALPDRAHDLRKILERAASTAGVDLDIRYELNSPAMLVAVAKAGLAHAILPNSACVEALAALSVASRPIVGPGLCRVQAVVWSQDRPPTPATAAVRDALVDTVEALVCEGSLQGRFVGTSHKGE